MTRARKKQPPKTKKYFRSTKSGAGMTKAGVARYRRDNPGSKAAKRRKSFCARSAGQAKKHNINCAKTPKKRICATRRRWKC